ncbi:MAG: YggT family protein [Herpetosiphonaceae bacterium]|nr:MAG: YggT family protein [Herpetosiphonaceae bacterium]
MGFLQIFFSLLINVLMIAILGRVIMSWVDPMRRMFLSRLFHELTEPILAPIRMILPSVGMFDFSPIVALLLLQVLQRIIVAIN